MTNIYLSVTLLVAATAACGDDTSSTSGNGGAGGDDPVVTVAGAGGHPGCEPGDQLACRCPDGAAGTSTCVTNHAGETSFSKCEC